jgi:nitrite reductase (NADH) large subunit
VNRPRLAIIGNGMATSRLLDELSRRGGLTRFEVSVFGEEAHGSYNRILLNKVLLGGSVDDITMKPSRWYADKGVHVFSGVTVTRLSHAARRLWTSDGREHRFDMAVFATGSTARVPDVEGLRRPDGSLKAGIFAYRTVDDVQRMRAFVRSGTRVAVVGGGLLGLEAAKGLSDLGAAVTVVHLFDVLMNRQVDALGGRFLRSAIEELGIGVRTSTSTKAIVGAARVEALEFGGGGRLLCEMVVFASGIAPRIDLARDSDLPTNAAILVDDRLQTGLTDIYAVGECAEHREIVHGTVQPIYEQCAVLADVLTGANPDAVYHGSKVYTKLKVAGVEVASMGRIEATHARDEVVQIVEERRRVYRKLVIEDDRLAGAVLVGDTAAAADLVQWLDRRVRLPENRLDLFASGDAIAGADADPEICNCHRVRQSTIQSAIRNGCDTLPKLSGATQAGTGCGSCRGQLANLILQSTHAAHAGAKG